MGGESADAFWDLSGKILGYGASEMSQSAQIDRFRITPQIGASGLGTVDEALDPELECLVAIRVLRHETLARDSELVQRLFVKPRAARAIGHLGGVQISAAKRPVDGSGCGGEKT